MASPVSSTSAVSTRQKVAAVFASIARWIFFVLAAAIVGVVPCLFGGMGPDGYWGIVWAGRLSVLPLVLWIISKILRREPLGLEFWLPVIYWSLLAVQVVLSTHNKSSAPVAPWLGHGFDAVPYDVNWPSTAFRQATEVTGQLWLSLGLIALSARTVGCGARQFRALLWIFAGTAAVLAVAGIPFKFSGQTLILGKWPAPEWYFYSTFLYHNHWCAYALFALGAVAALFAESSRLATRGLLAIMGTVLVASAPLSVSRLGTIAMALFVLAIIVVVVMGAREPFQKRFKAWPAVVACILVGIFATAGAALHFSQNQNAPGGQRTWTRLLHSNPFGIRQSLAEDTLLMFRDKPWFGCGLGAFGGAFRFYQREETRVVYNNGRITLYDHPHNDWLEMLAELGLVGTFLALAPGLAWLKLAAPFSIRSQRDKWIIGGCVALFLFALGDDVFLNRAVVGSFAVFFPLALRRDIDFAPTRRR